MKAVSAEWTDHGREATASNTPCSAGHRHSPVVVMRAAADRLSDELAVRMLLSDEFRGGVRNPVDALVDASGVVPAGVFGNSRTQLAFVPHQDTVPQFTTQGADEALDMGLSIGCVVGNGDPSDAHHIGRLYVEGRAAGDVLATDLDRARPVPP